MMNNLVSTTTYRDLCSDPGQNPAGAGEELLESIAAHYASWHVDKPSETLKEDLLLDMGVTMTGGVCVMVLCCRFYIKCTACVSEICFRTDPESCDYVIEAGATR